VISIRVKLDKKVNKKGGSTQQITTNHNTDLEMGNIGWTIRELPEEEAEGCNDH